MSTPSAASPLDRRVGELELKEMDGVLLVADIRARAAAAGLPLGRLDEAIVLAAWAHRDKRRLARGDLPSTAYIEHPLRNAARVLRWGTGSEEIVLACLLHDTVEDHALEIADLVGTPTSDEAVAREVVFADYAERFGTEAAALVRAMSNPIAGDSGAGETRRHEEYRAHVITEIADPRVAVCKLADLADNALSLHHTASDAAPERTARLARKYAPLLPVFAARVRDADVRELLGPEGVAVVERALADGIARIARLAE